MLEYNLLNGAPRGPFGYFIEELSNEEFISYGALTSLVGVTQGTAINEGSGWLKFEMDGVELIVAKKSIRERLSWNHLNVLGLVFGETEVKIGGNLYKVRLLSGADNDPSVSPYSVNYREGTHESEWSKLFYPIVKDDSFDPNRDLQAPYRMSDIQMNTAPWSWCREVHGTGTNYRVIRGYERVTRFGREIFNTSNNSISGWRPCLELIPPIQPPVLDVGYYFNPDYLFTGPNNLRGVYISDLQI